MPRFLLPTPLLILVVVFRGAMSRFSETTEEVVKHLTGASGHLVLAHGESQHNMLGMQALRFAFHTQIKIGTLNAFVTQIGNDCFASIAYDSGDHTWDVVIIINLPAARVDDYVEYLYIIFHFCQCYDEFFIGRHSYVVTVGVYEQQNLYIQQRNFRNYIPSQVIL